MRIEVCAGGGDDVAVWRDLQPVDQEGPVGLQLKAAGAVLHQGCAVGQNIEAGNPVIHGDAVVVLQPDELGASTIAHAHAVVLEVRQNNR